MRNSLLTLALLLLASPACRAADTYAGPDVRDPFNDPAVKGSKSTVKGEISNMSFTLEGVVWESDRPQAIINGKIVERGSDIGGAEVLEIGRKGVRMRYKGQEFILRPKGKLQ